MIRTLVIVIILLILALWISVMLLWWRTEQEKPVKTIKRGDIVRTINKAIRAGRKSWYTSLRYSKQVAAWGNKKARTAFVAVFPKSKPAFVKQDPLTGLEHGPSSYFLANLTKTPAPAPKKRAYTKRKKVEPVPTLEVEPQEEQLSE